MYSELQSRDGMYGSVMPMLRVVRYRLVKAQ